MRPFMRTPLLGRRDADMEVVESFYGDIDFHEKTKKVNRSIGKVKEPNWVLL